MRTMTWRKSVALGLFATSFGALAFACGGGSESGSQGSGLACGSSTCSEGQVCDDKVEPARCGCPEGFAGADCSRCADGFSKDGDKCVPTPIDCNVAGICGPRGTCLRTILSVSGPDGGGLSFPVDGGDGGRPPLGSYEDHCSCKVGWAGRVCERCEDGKQDYDHDGVCEPTCETAGLSCGAPRACNDRFGVAFCACPPDRQGQDCELCLEGYKRVGDGECQPTCALSWKRACPGRSHCEDEALPAKCACDVGYTGDDCSACADGFTKDAAGVCVRSAPAGSTLLATMERSREGTPVRALVAIDPTTGALTPLRTVPSDTGGLAVDLANKVLYARVDENIGTVDVASGAFSPLLKGTWSAYAPTPLAYHPGQAALFSHTFGSPYNLKKIDIAAKTASTVGSDTGVSWAHSMAYEPATGALLLVRVQGGGGELYRIDPSTAAATSVPWTLGAGVNSALGIAVEPTSSATYVLARKSRPADELLAAECAAMAEGLGYAGYKGVPTSKQGTAPLTGGETINFPSAQASGKELVLFQQYGDRNKAPTNLRITTSNPEAGVCIDTYEAPLNVQLAADAKVAFVIVTSYYDTVKLAVDSGFPAPARPVVHVRMSTNKADPSLAAPFARAYSNEEWSDRRLENLYHLANVDVLVELDGTFKAVRTVPLAERMGVSLAPWSP